MAKCSRRVTRFSLSLLAKAMPEGICPRSLAAIAIFPELARTCGGWTDTSRAGDPGPAGKPPSELVGLEHHLFTLFSSINKDVRRFSLLRQLNGSAPPTLGQPGDKESLPPSGRVASAISAGFQAL